MSKYLVINTEPKKEEHICYYVIRNGRDLQLHEIVEVTYSHPDAPDHANIINVETRCVDRGKDHEDKCSSWILLEAIEKTTQRDR